MVTYTVYRSTPDGLVLEPVSPPMWHGPATHGFAKGGILTPVKVTGELRMRRLIAVAEHMLPSNKRGSIRAYLKEAPKGWLVDVYTIDLPCGRRRAQEIVEVFRATADGGDRTDLLTNFVPFNHKASTTT